MPMSLVSPSVTTAGQVTAVDALFAELADDEASSARLVRFRAAETTSVPDDVRASVHIRSAVAAALAGDVQQAEMALVAARGAARPAPDDLLALAWSLVMIETGRPARAVAHLDRARCALEPGGDPADLWSVLQLLDAQARLGDVGVASARQLAADGLRALSPQQAAGACGVYGHLVSAELAFAAGDLPDAAAHVAAVARAGARAGLLAGRADVLEARLRFAETRDVAAAGALLDRAIDRFGRIGAPRDLGLAHAVRAMHAAADPAEAPARWRARARPLLARLGGAVERQLVRAQRRVEAGRARAVSPKVAAAVEELRRRRTRLNEVVSSHCECGGAAADCNPHACDGYRAIDDVLAMVTTAEEQLTAHIEQASQDGTSVARLAGATRDLSAIDEPREILARIPELARLVLPGAAAALLRVSRADGSIEALASSGAAFELPRARLEEAARDAAREGTRDGPGGGDGCRAAHGPRHAGRATVLCVVGGADALVLAVERAEGAAPATAAESAHLSLYAAFAASALARARAGGPRREAGSPSAPAPRARAGAQRGGGSAARFTFDDLVGAAPAFLRVVEDARRAARSDVPVLVCGESGTGKELLAQAIHNASARAAGPFVGINVTAIPHELLESELFGYEGGAFTGARTAGRAGKFELAARGTLLLDEIGDMPLEMQSKLLRVLQEKLVQRLGSAHDVAVCARFIATTHCDLAEAVSRGTFRLDLFHRLRVLQLHLPPLRARKEDVPLLVEHQLRRHAQDTRQRVRVAPHVLAALQAHDWPGNVRELHNVIEGELSLLSPGEDVLTRVPAVLLQARSRAARAPEVLPLDEVERRACEQALAVFEGNVARAAEALNIAKGTLYRMMRRHGIAPAPAAPRRQGADGHADATDDACVELPLRRRPVLQ
jgi:DNA-binding NtrC family response regulator